MNKNMIWTIGLLALVSILIGACAPLTPVDSAIEESAQPETTTANTAPGNGNQQGMAQGEECDGTGQHSGGNGAGHGHSGEGAQTPSYAVGEISQAEADGLAFMREEEKLARDVYLTLYDVWELRPFSNIASSEQTHTDQVKALLEMYGVTDPVTDDTIGVFANDDLQSLYNDLIDKGNVSLVDAIEVGAAVEEIDILDLIEYIDGTEEANLEWVYENLLAGSENHLRAFVKQYEQQTGETYVPQYLSQDAYDAIISASNGQGGGSGHGNGGGGGGGQHGKGNNG